MKNLILIVLILIVVGFIGGFIQYVDCRACAGDFPYRHYNSIEFRKNQNNIQADFVFTYCFDTKYNCNNLDFENYRTGDLQWLKVVEFAE